MRCADQKSRSDVEQRASIAGRFIGDFNGARAGALSFFERG